MPNCVVFDLDDFCEEIMSSYYWELIYELKRVAPDLKITMFTIPLKCSEAWLKSMKKIEWIEMHYHGSNHIDKDEWLNRTDLKNLHENQDFFYNGFKAPWWRLDQQTADLFKDKKYILSLNKDYFDVNYDKAYRFNIGKTLIPGVSYSNKDYLSIHSHVQEQKNKDGLPDIFDEICSLIKKNRNKKFKFISELF